MLPLAPRLQQSAYPAPIMHHAPGRLPAYRGQGGQGQTKKDLCGQDAFASSEADKIDESLACTCACCLHGHPQDEAGVLAADSSEESRLAAHLKNEDPRMLKLREDTCPLRSTLRAYGRAPVQVSEGATSNIAAAREAAPRLPCSAPTDRLETAGRIAFSLVFTIPAHPGRPGCALWWR